MSSGLFPSHNLITLAPHIVLRVLQLAALEIHECLPASTDLRQQDAVSRKMRSMSIPDMTLQLMGCVRSVSPHLLDLGLGIHHEGTVLHIEKGNRE